MHTTTTRAVDIRSRTESSEAAPGRTSGARAWSTRVTRVGVSAVVSALSLIATRPAHAQEPDAATDPNRSPYEVNVPLDLGISLGAMVLGGMPRLFAKETLRPWCGLACDPAHVNALDRTVIGHHSYAALQVSNVGFFTSMGLPFVLGAVDRLTSDPVDGTTGMLKDDLVLIQTLAIVLVTNNAFSFIIRRPRPLTYDTSLTDEERLDANNSFSFPSGHTAVAFSMATAYSRIYMQRHPESGWIAPLWIGTYAIAAMTGALRTYSGDHFWTDVFAGVVTGIGLGLLVPWMHRKQGGSEVTGSDPAAIDVQQATLAFDPNDVAALLFD